MSSQLATLPIMLPAVKDGLSPTITFQGFPVNTGFDLSKIPTLTVGAGFLRITGVASGERLTTSLGERAHLLHPVAAVRGAPERR